MKRVFIILGLLVTVGFGCSSGTSVISSKNCSYLEPRNPYGSGTGHYAGYQWGESGKSCGGNSNSFIEGCEEHENQESNYQNCLSK